MTTTFESAKVGDPVWCMRSGWGDIRDVGSTERYPISVYFPEVDEFNSYTTDGFYDENHITQSLFWDEVVIVAPEKPLPKLEVDTKVLVWTDPNKKNKRHFSHFNHGRIYTFDSGSTSFTKLHRDSVTGWPHWELAE